MFLRTMNERIKPSKGSTVILTLTYATKFYLEVRARHNHIFVEQTKDQAGFRFGPIVGPCMLDKICQKE